VTASTERYHRHHRIATGGMGEVWLAEDNVLHREVAVKYLKREYADDTGFHDRFLNEARAVTNLIGNGIGTIAIAKWDNSFDAETCQRELAALKDEKAAKKALLAQK